MNNKLDILTDVTEEELKRYTKDANGATMLDGKIVRIPATKDYMFKNLFGVNGKEENLRHLLQAILKIKIKSVEIQNPELPRVRENDKKGILDVRAKLDNGTTVFIEMQVRDENNIGERMTFYICKLYASTVESGEQYREIEKSVAIVITNFSYFNRKEYHQIAHLKFEECKNKEEIVEEYLKNESDIITDKLELHIIDLKRFKEMKEPKGELADWLKLIIGDERGIAMSSKNNKAIEKANRENKILSMDKQMQEDYWYQQKELYAENTRISAAKDEGIQIGKIKGKKEGIEIGEKKGKQQEKIKIAKRLLKLNIDIDKIIEATGLSKEEIENLKK